MLTVEELLAGETRYHAVSGLYRNTRQEHFFWFAFRSPRDWVELDAETRSNGAIHIDFDGNRWGILLVDGAVVMRCHAGGPGYRRLHAMVEPALRSPSPTPQTVEPAEWEGRQALRCRWDDDRGTREALFDLASGLVLRTETADEVVELSRLVFDDTVPGEAFLPPDRSHDDWRGGTAYIQQDAQSGLSSASWRPRSGPGALSLRGPEAVRLDVAMDWARTRTDDIRVSETRPRPD